MDGHRWRMVERVLDATLESDPERWQAILDEHCGDDLELRREVEALLARYTTAQRFLNVPPAAAAAALIAEAAGAEIDEGRRIGSTLAARYHLVREVGRGGMATVYLARDERHGREVAVKILRPELATSFRRGRFLREIEIAARLTHPLILPVHDSGDADGLLFYVMPHVEGETLRARIGHKQALPLPEAISILRDVAEALAYAHARGVIHRDVKPDNIMLAGRHALVADFGVAKAIQEATVGLGTVTSAGVALGTPAYMAPEQAVADPQVDHRADLYALGVVTYEMLSGRPPFSARSAQELLAAHVSHEPRPLERHGASVPSELTQLVMKCLRKKADDRWQSADEILERLEAIVTPAGTTPTQPVAPLRAPRRVALSVAAVTVIGVIAVAASLALRTSPRALPRGAPAMRQVTFTGDVRHAALSPDGRYLALVRSTDSGPRAFLREVAAAAADAVPIARGSSANEVAWTGDGSEIVVRTVDSQNEPTGYVRAPLVGTATRAISGSGFHQRLSPDGARVAGWYISHKTVALRTVASRDTLRVGVPGEYTWLRHVAWSPDSRRLAVLLLWEDGPVSRLVVVDPAGGQRPGELFRDSVQVLTPVWSPGGDAIYYLREREGAWDLWKVGVSPGTGQTARAPVLVTPGLEVGRTHPGDGAELDAFSITADGRHLAYVRERTRVNLILVELDEAAQMYRRVHDLTAGTSIKGPPAISPDGAWIAFADGDRVRGDVYVMPVRGGTPTRLTTLGTVRSSVAWSPEGDRIAFVATESGRSTVWWVSIDGATTRQYPESRVGTELKKLVWNPGTEILYQRPGNRGWHRLDPTTGSEIPLVPNDSPGWMFDAAVSPDGETVAVRWNRRPRGIWLITRSNGDARLLIGGEYYYHLGWEPDGAALRVISERTGGVARVALNGRVLGNAPALPAACSDLPATLDFRRMVCPQIVSERDVWIVEDFDPEVRDRPN